MKSGVQHGILWSFVAERMQDTPCCFPKGGVMDQVGMSVRWAWCKDDLPHNLAAASELLRISTIA